MAVIHLIDIPTWLSSISFLGESGHGLLWQFHVDWSILAQQQFNTDVFAGARNWFDNFVQSGQIWALLVGFVVGYLFRSFTTYG